MRFRKKNGQEVEAVVFGAPVKQKGSLDLELIELKNGQLAYRGRPAKYHDDGDRIPSVPKSGGGYDNGTGYIGGMSIFDQLTNNIYQVYYTTYS